MSLGRRVAFPAALALVLLLHIVVAAHSLLVLHLWEDEAFNLTVPLNLLRGLGYTSDGTLSGSTLTPFDPRISTGPVVLLPITAALATGADMAIAGRSVMLLFYAGLLVGLWIVGRRVGGRWAGLVAVAVPLALQTNVSPSPIQGPADILGEIPAAALLVFALATYRSRPWLAGLFLGLAMQCKFIALLAAPALVLAVFFTVPGQSFSRRIGRVWRMVVAALVPSVLFELTKLVALGPAAYWQNTRHFVGFLISGGQSVGRVPLLAKLGALLSSWELPAAVTTLVVVLAVATIGMALLMARVGADGDPTQPSQYFSRDALLLLGASTLGLLTWCAWWLASMHTPVWIRHPSPGLFTFAPVLAAYVVLALRVLGRTPRSWTRAAAAVGATALAAGLVVQVGGRLADTLVAPTQTLAEQRAAASDVSRLNEAWLAGRWGDTVSISVMSGAHAALADAPDVTAIPRIMVRNKAGAGVRTMCGEPLLITGPYIVCEAPKL